MKKPKATLFGATVTYLRSFQTAPSFLSLWLPLCLVAINLLLKFRHLGVQSLAGDEVFSAYVSQFDVTTIVKYLSQGNNPPLFEIMLHYWIKVFGIGASSVRVLPCLFSGLTVWFIYKVGTDFFNFKTGIISAILYTLSNYHMYFAHETRVYSLFLLLTCISFYAYMHLIKSPSLTFRIIHALTLILLPYAHYLAFFVLFIQLFLVLTLKEIRTKILKQYLINLAIALILFIPFIFIFITRFCDSTIHGTWLHPVTSLGQLHDVLKYLTNNSVTNYLVFMVVFWLVVQRFINETISSGLIKYLIAIISIFFLFYGISIMGPMPYFWEFTSKPSAMISYLFFMVAMIIFSLSSKTISVYTKVILVWFFVPLLVMFVASFWVPMFLDRYLIYITGGFYLLIGIGVSYLEETKPLKIGLLLILLLCITFETNVDKKRHVAEVVQKVNELRTSNTIVYICPDNFDYNFAYYYNRHYFKDIDDPDAKTKLRKHLASQNIYPISNTRQLDTAMLKKADKIIYIDAAADFVYPGNGIKAKLDSILNLKQQYEIPEIYRVIEYINHK